LEALLSQSPYPMEQLPTAHALAPQVAIACARAQALQPVVVQPNPGSLSSAHLSSHTFSPVAHDAGG
jgi:hypothetical protein